MNSALVAWSSDTVYSTALEVRHLSCLDQLSIQARFTSQKVARLVGT